MNVLMLAPQPYFEPRGTPISVYQRLQGLASLGHTIDLVTYHLGEDVQIGGVTIHRIPHVPFIHEVKIGPSWSKPLLDLLLFFKALGLLATRRYDLIHSHEEAAFFSTILASMFRTHHLYDMHSSLPRQLVNFNVGNYRPLIKLFEMLERWTIKNCDAVITISSDLEQHVKVISPGVNQVMIDNLPVEMTDVDLQAVNQLKERLGLEQKLPIVYTGSLERYQGIDLLIESATVVRNCHPEVAFVLVGGKPQQVEYWKQEACKQGLADCIRFVGSVPLGEIHSYLGLGEVLVSPRTEGTSVPLKIYTYLLSGKPIVATNLLTHTLVLNDDIAVLVEPTKEAVAEGLLKLIRDRELRQRLSQEAQQYAKDMYDPEQYREKLDQIYRTLESSLRVRQRHALP